MFVLARREGRKEPWGPVGGQNCPGRWLPVLGSAGSGGEIGAGGCPGLQESVCAGGAELLSDSLLQGAVFCFFFKFNKMLTVVVTYQLLRVVLNTAVA